jgi:hypothetical protein
MKMDLGKTWDGSEEDIFDAGLLRSGDGDAVSIATQASRDPNDVHIGYGGRLGD